MEREVGVRISGCEWSCHTIPAELQRGRQIGRKGLPILFLDRRIVLLRSVALQPSHMSQVDKQTQTPTLRSSLTTLVTTP